MTSADEVRMSETKSFLAGPPLCVLRAVLQYFLILDFTSWSSSSAENVLEKQCFIK